MYKTIEERNGKLIVNGHELGELLEAMPNGWRIIEGATTAPIGYKWITNGRSLFGNEHKQALIREENLHRPILTPEQLRDEWQRETEEIIAEAKEKGYYYPEMCADREYTRNNGAKCYRTIGGIDYYFLKCEQLGIAPKCLAYGLHYEADGNGFTLEYCERDIFLAFNA